MGDDRDYHQNITYHQGRNFEPSSYPSFDTSNHEIMIKFIKTVKFKEIRYNEKDIAVILAIKEMYPK
jgi:hypothetical protein